MDNGDWRQAVCRWRRISRNLAGMRWQVRADEELLLLRNLGDQVWQWHLRLTNDNVVYQGISGGCPSDDAVALSPAPPTPAYLTARLIDNTCVMPPDPTTTRTPPSSS